MCGVPTPVAAYSDGVGCVSGWLGGTVVCGAGYTVQIPGQEVAPAPVAPPSRNESSTPPSKPVALALYVANGPNGPCMALGQALPVTVVTQEWLNTVKYPSCPQPPNGGQQNLP